MENFKRNNRFSGRSGSGGFGGRNSGRPTMHKAICSKCGKDCEVPFKPTGDKPIFCSECFRSEGNNEQRRSGGRDSRRPSFGDKRMYEATCAECGVKCEVPFKPRGDKPVLCSDCFSKENSNRSSYQSKKELEIIETKLDKILELLSPAVSKKTKVKKETVKKEKVVKAKKGTVKKVKVVKAKKGTVKKVKVVKAKKVSKPKKKTSVSKTKTKGKKKTK